MLRQVREACELRSHTSATWSHRLWLAAAGDELRCAARLEESRFRKRIETGTADLLDDNRGQVVVGVAIGPTGPREEVEVRP